MQKTGLADDDIEPQRQNDIHQGGRHDVDLIGGEEKGKGQRYSAQDDHDRPVYLWFFLNALDQRL